MKYSNTWWNHCSCAKPKDGPIFHLSKFPNPRPKTRGAGLWRGCGHEKRGWESQSDLASHSHLTSLRLLGCLFSFQQLLSTIFQPSTSKFIATCNMSLRSVTSFPSQPRSAQALCSLSPHIPPLPSPGRWPPHLHPHAGARGGACHCDGWVCGSNPWTTPAACRVAGSMRQPCRDGRWWPTPPGLPPGQWEVDMILFAGGIKMEWWQMHTYHQETV